MAVEKLFWSDPCLRATTAVVTGVLEMQINFDQAITYARLGERIQIRARLWVQRFGAEKRGTGMVDRLPTDQFLLDGCTFKRMYKAVQRRLPACGLFGFRLVDFTDE